MQIQSYTKRVNAGTSLAWLTDLLSLGENCANHGVGFEQDADGSYSFSLECPRCSTLASGVLTSAPERYGFGLALNLEFAYTRHACKHCLNAAGAPSAFFLRVEEGDNGDEEIVLDRSDGFQKGAGVFSVVLVYAPENAGPMIATFDSLEKLRLAFSTLN